MHKLHIPYIQCLRKILMIINILQPRIALIDDPVIISQITQINLIKLRKLKIDKTSSSRRSLFDDVQIFRRKKYKMYDSE